MQRFVNLVDLVKRFPTSIHLQKSASIQLKTSPDKFAVQVGLARARWARSHPRPEPARPSAVYRRRSAAWYKLGMETSPTSPNEPYLYRKLVGARFQLYRRRFLQVNIRWKALDEIYKMYMLFALLRPQYFSKRLSIVWRFQPC